MQFLREICKNCGFTFGSHRTPDDACPATEGGMDYAQGPGTKFKPTGKLKKGTDDKDI